MNNIAMYLVILILVGTMGQVTSDMYLPSLPAISQGLQASVTLAQLTVSFYMYGLAVSQLFYGPVSDAIGRRKPLLVGLVICVGGGIVCALSTSIYVLIFGRFLQGLGAGAGISLSRTITRDILEGTDLAKFLSYLTMGSVAFMTCAPMAGGYIQHYIGWRANFVVLLLYALTALAVIAWFLPETNRHLRPENLQRKTLQMNVMRLLTSRVFIGYSLCALLTYGGILVWLTVGPILLIKKLGLSPVHYGWISLLVGATFAINAQLNARFVVKWGIIKTMQRGFFFMLAMAVLLGGLGLLGYVNPLVVILPSVLFVGAGGFIFANVITGALTPFPKMAGTASAILCCFQMLGGAVSSTLMSYLHDENQLPMAIVLTVMSLSALIIMRWLIKPL